LRGKGGKIVVPAKCWKVVLVVPAGTTDPKKVTAEARVFAAIMPNAQGLDRDWRHYAVPVKDVEALTGYTFFGRLHPDLAKELRSREPETRARRKVAATEAKGERPPKKGEAAGLELPAFVAGCAVGNRQSKIYHVSGGRGYEAAQKSKNAVFFKTAADAEKAGFTRAKR
jgi:hypothetical protein